MDNNTTTPVVTSTPTYGTTPPRKKSKRGLIIVIIVAIILGALFFIFKPFGGGTKAEPTPTVQIQPTEEPTPTEDVTPTPEEESPTPKPSAKPTAGAVTSAHTMHIQVVNGTGEVGVAGAGASHLTSRGYTNVDTGNADSTDAQGVTVQIKSKYSQYEDTLIADLKEKYSSVTSGTALSDDSDFDAVVTIGK